MTHSCIRIVSGNRSIMLHTYHTGMSIPKLLPRAIDLRVRGRAYLRRPEDTDEDVVERIICFAAADGLDYVDTIAALLIAARPNFLHPVSRGTRKDLPTWSGIDKPFVLRVVGPGLTWKLFDEGGKLIATYDVGEEIIKRIREIPPDRREFDRDIYCADCGKSVTGVELRLEIPVCEQCRIKAVHGCYGWGPKQGQGLPVFRRHGKGWQLGDGVVVVPWQGKDTPPVPDDRSEALLQVELANSIRRTWLPLARDVPDEAAVEEK